jgi:hypothetical protein
MRNKLITVLLYALLAFVWFIILRFSLFAFCFSPLLQHFWNGGLILLFGFLGILAFILPVIFRKKLSSNWMKPVAMLILTGFALLASYGILNAAVSYVSVFRKKVWDTNHELRIYMTDDLENNYHVTGKTEQEILALLGEPASISEYKGRTFEYYIGSGFIDPITYDIMFENGIAVHAEKVSH